MTMVKLNNRPVVKNFDSLFNEFFNSFPTAWERGAKEDNFYFPAINVHETKEAYHLELNAPGRNKEDFKVNFENGLLSIGYEQKAEEKQDDYKTIRREFAYKSFKRSFQLDDNVDAEKIQARYENGILKLLLPKKEEQKPDNKQISVQ